MARKKNMFAALPSSTMLIAILGFFVSVVYFMPRWPSFGFSFMLVFVMMFVASMLSMTFAPEQDILLMEEYEKEHKGAKLVESKIMKKFEKFFGLKNK